ncbi:phosphohistidine phosphatase sixa [hydrocarbon metagenome]|uniref:Phosphohistidine phosphatase sixa n=1 Tax=hydrocarbon metagenome TaxID=938273 RepID=A0A0W8FYD6_9ZZZZ
MNLYIVRHAHAENGVPDSERKLSQHGRDYLSDEIQNWKTKIKQIDVILTSPYKRALETAEIIHKNFAVKHNLIIDQSLQPVMNIPDIVNTLSALSVNNILLVGHMPDVADLTSLLISTKNVELAFAPATIAAIEFKNNVMLYRGKFKFITNKKI